MALQKKPKRRWWAVAARPATGGSLPLDLVSGTVAAYSLRRLRNAYSGAVVNVRRSSDNATKDIGFAGNDFDVAGFNTFVGGGSGFVAIWYDQSGNGAGYSAIQGTAATQPQITPIAAPRGGPAVTFTTGATGVTATVPASTIPLALNGVVTRTGALTSFDTFLALSGVNPPSLLYVNSPGISFGNAGLDGITVVTPDNQFHSATGVMNGASSLLTVDGTSTSGTLGNQPGSTSFSIGFGNFIGSLCEGIYFTGALSGAAITNLAVNQKTYWGTP